MNDHSRKNAALTKMAQRVFPTGRIEATHDKRDVFVTTNDEVTLTAVETFMALLEPASVTIRPCSDETAEIGFYACRKLPWEL